MSVLGFMVFAPIFTIRVSGMLHNRRRGRGMKVRVIMLVPSVPTMNMTMYG